MKRDKFRIGILIILQLMNILYSLDSVLIKKVSVKWEMDGGLSVSALSLFAGAVILLAVYALLWQKILSRVDLTVAYMCKGMIIFWGMMWASIFFGERISVFNILGTILIFIGTILVTVDE